MFQLSNSCVPIVLLVIRTLDKLIVSSATEKEKMDAITAHAARITNEKFELDARKPSDRNADVDKTDDGSRVTHLELLVRSAV